MANLSTTLFGITMPSPFILASGPLSYDATGLWEAYRAGAGGIVTKTLRLEAAINPTPHMVVPRSSNLRATLFNTEKWADLTWEHWVAVELPALAGHPGMLIASIGHTPAEGEVIAGPVAATGVVDAIECVAYTKATIVDLVRRVREQAPKTPILAKLTFNWGDELYPAAEEALKAGADGFTAIDSIGPTLQIDIETGEPTIGGAGNKAWMSGAAIRPVAQAVVSELADPLSGRADRRHRRHHPGRGRGGDDDGGRERAGRLHRAAAARAGVVRPHGREVERLAGQPRLCRPVGRPRDGAAETARRGRHQPAHV